MTNNGPLLGFVSRPFFLHLPLHDHHVKHLQTGVEALARLAAGEDDAPLMVPPELSESQRGDDLSLSQSHGQVADQ